MEKQTCPYVPCFIVALTWLLLAAPGAQAGTRYWDGGSTNIPGNGNSASSGGDGTWSTTNKNWDAGSVPHTNWVNANNDTAVFGGTAGMVTNQGVIVGGLTFSTANYVLTNSTVTFGVAGTISCSAAATIASELTGAGAITKAGVGVLTLSGSNTYSGKTTISVGVLLLNSTNALPGGIGTSGGTGALTFSGGILGLGAGDFTRSPGNGVNGAYYFASSGGWAAYGADRLVNIKGTGETVGFGSSSFPIAFNGAILILGAANATHKVTIVNGVDLYWSMRTVQVEDGAAAVDAEFSGVLRGIAGGGLIKTGSGTLALTASNTYTGVTVINGGKLQLGNGGATGSLATASITNNATLIYNRSDNISVGYTISGSGQLIKQGAGILTFTNALTYSGNTTVSAGTLSYNTPNPSNEASAVTIASGATLNLNFSGTDTVARFFIGTTLMATGIYEAIGNPGSGIEIPQITGAGSLAVTGDIIPPFVDDQDGGRIGVGTLVTYTVTFDQDMDDATVSADDFSNASSAGITIGTITETAPGIFTVEVTPTTTGTLQLQIPAGATLNDSVGNPLDTSLALLDDTILTVFAPDPVSPTLRGISAVANSSGTNLSIALPAGVQAGDLLLASIAQYGSSSGNATDAGWTRINGRTLGGSTAHYGTVLYRVATGYETGTQTFGLIGTSPVAAGVIMAFSGVDTSGGPFDATTGTLYTGSAATNAVGPAAQVTTVSSNALVVMLGMAVGTNATWSGWTNASPGALDEQVDVQGSGTGNNATSLGAAWAVKAVPGASGTGSATLSASARNGSILLALKPAYSDELVAALVALKNHINGSAPLDGAQITTNKLTIDAQKLRFGSSVSAIAAALDLVATYDRVLGPLWVARSLPNRVDVTNDDIHWAICTVMQNIMDWTYTAANIANHADLLDGFKFGSSAYFPGACAPPADPNTTNSVRINANFPDTWGRPTWEETPEATKPTGNYLAPGSIATVTVPSSIVGRGYNIRIGCHKWDMSNRPTFTRMDRLTVLYPINSTETRVANPFGGGIYIEVPAYVTNVGIVNIEIVNAVRSPYFSAKSFHTTTPAEWLTERARPAPWADFQSEKYMMQVPTSWISAMPDPTQLMKDWDIAADTCNDLMGFPRVRGKETMYDQIDVNLHKSAGYPGYPTSNYTGSGLPGSGNGYSSWYLVRGPQHATDIQFHEHGHGYYIPLLPGDIESVINILHVAVWNESFGYSLNDAFRASRDNQPAYATLDTTAMAWMTCFNFVNGVPMAQLEKQYQLKGHAKFVDIARLFGWSTLNQYWYSFNSDYENNLSYGTDVDSQLLRLSKAAGVDIRPLFHFWGVPPVNTNSLAAAISAANLPASPAIYNTLIHYQSLAPANNAAFQSFALNWWGRQPNTSDTNSVEEYNHTIQWTNYNEAACSAVQARAQQILDQYFPACQLTVSSAYGTPDPSGVSTSNWGTVLNASLANSPVINGVTQYVCQGWSGTGSLTNGSGANASFTITNDTTLTWQWQTNYWINFSVIGN